MARSRSSPGEGRMVLQTIVLPRICSSSRAASAARNRRSSSLAAHCSNSSRAAAAKSSSGTATKRGSPQQQQQLQYSPSNILRHRSVFLLLRNDLCCKTMISCKSYIHRQGGFNSKNKLFCECILSFSLPLLWGSLPLCLSFNRL